MATVYPMGRLMESSKITSKIVGHFGPSSPIFRVFRDGLAELYYQLKDSPALNQRLLQWQRCLDLIYVNRIPDVNLFLEHTYVAILARLVVYLDLGFNPHPTENDLGNILTGEFFSEYAGLQDFVEADVFSWPFLDNSVKHNSLVLARDLLNNVNSHDFVGLGEQILEDLYRRFEDTEIDRSTTAHPIRERNNPEWSAERLFRVEIDLGSNPKLSLLDPYCGTGNFLFAGLQIILQGLTSAGMNPRSILDHILENVAGMDPHPLAVVIARTRYVLAVRDLLKQRGRLDITIPVYLADASQPPKLMSPPVLAYSSTGIPSNPILRQCKTENEEREERNDLSGGQDAYVITTDGPSAMLLIPHSLAINPVGLDYLLPKMKNKYAVAIQRAQNEAMLGRAWYSFHNFLVAGTGRKPFVLSETDAHTVVQTLAGFVKLMEQDKDTIWYCILRNEMRSVYLQNKQFDLVVSNPRRPSIDQTDNTKQGNLDSSNLRFHEVAESYLRKGGRVFISSPI